MYLDGTNTGIILQGWPQSPPAPPLFPWTTEVNGNAITLTLTGDFLPGTAGPGPKQVHLLLGGFSNPQKAGKYAIELTIKPDPASDETLQGTGTVEILPEIRRSIEPFSGINGAPPPPFPNALYQTLAPGEEPLPWGFYIWDRKGMPELGADIVKQHDTLYWIVNGKGQRIGWVKVRPPKGAKSFEVATTGPAVAADAFGTAIPTALLKAQFTPDPHATGRYQVIWHLSGGTTQWMHVKVSPKEKLTVVTVNESADVTGFDTPRHEDDVLIFENTIHDGLGGPQIGRNAGRCDGTGPFPGMSPSHVCFTVMSLADGDIWSSSWIPNPGEPIGNGAIIGGTGKYAHASGTVSFTDLSEAGDFSVGENVFAIRYAAPASKNGSVQFTNVSLNETAEVTGFETSQHEDDVLIFENTIHESEGGPQVGRSAGRCDGTGAFPGESPSHVCLTVNSFADGDVWTASWIANPGEPLAGVAIIGGTGKYAHASGTVEITDISEAGDLSVAENAYDMQLNAPTKKRSTRNIGRGGRRVGRFHGHRHARERG